MLLGYASTGLHTNGYTLARRIVFDGCGRGLGDTLGDTGMTVADALLAVHRSYYRERRSRAPAACRRWRTSPAAASRATWCGCCPQDCEAVVDPGSWELPPLFSTLQQAGQVSTDEMRDVFNLGVGLIAVLPADAVAAAQAAAAAAGVATWIMGEIRKGERAVRFAG